MFESRSKPGKGLLRERILAIVCLLLVAFFATVELVHAHGPTADSRADCALCVVAHASVINSAHFVIAAPKQERGEVCVMQAEIPRVFFIDSYDCRPPPAEPAAL